MMFNTIRIARVSVDIGENNVRVVRINGKGRIDRAGYAQMEPLSEGLSQEQRLECLSAAIAKAAQAAKIRGGACVLVTGGPHVIVRRFLWPAMPSDALMANAESEIAPYLPGVREQFQISYTILRSEQVISPETENMVERVDVLVAAMAKDTADLLKAAARKAGFFSKRIDIRENAREKLVDHKQLWPEYRQRASTTGEEVRGAILVPTDSFAILDVADSLVNMSVFINGVFYANRYFSASISAPVAAGVAAGGEDDGAHSFADNLAAEAASIIDYIHYQERGSTIGSVMLLGGGDEMDGLANSLRDNLDIPVICDPKALNGLLLSEGMEASGDTDAARYVDAYAAALVPEASREKDLDLTNKKQTQSALKKRLPLLIGLAAAVMLLMGAGIYFPAREIAKLEQAEKKLDAELSRYVTSDAELQALRLEVDLMRKVGTEWLAFYIQYPAASEVLQAVHDALPGGAGLYDIKIEQGTVVVRGTAVNLGTVAQYIDALRADGLFDDEIAHSVGNVPRNGENSRLGFPVVPIEAVYEDGAVDFELTLLAALALEVE